MHSARRLLGPARRDPILDRRAVSRTSLFVGIMCIYYKPCRGILCCFSAYKYVFEKVLIMNGSIYGDVAIECAKRGTVHHQPCEISSSLERRCERSVARVAKYSEVSSERVSSATTLSSGRFRCRQCRYHAPQAPRSHRCQSHGNPAPRCGKCGALTCPLDTASNMIIIGYYSPNAISACFHACFHHGEA
jgi:hypothetical protein